MAVTERLRVALTTYSVKPRGGVVHTLELAEALQAAGVDVTVVALSDQGKGFFREVGVPVRLVKHVSDNADASALDWPALVDRSAAALGAWLAERYRGRIG